MYISRILNRPCHRNPRNLKFSKINFRARFIIFNIANACCWLAGRVPNLALHKVWIWRHLTLHQPTTWSILVGFLSSTVTWFLGHLRSFILYVKIVVVIFGMEYGALCCSFGPSCSSQPTLFLLTTATTRGCNFDQWKGGLDLAWGWSHKISSFSDLPGLFDPGSNWGQMRSNRDRMRLVGS